MNMKKAQNYNDSVDTPDPPMNRKLPWAKPTVRALHVSGTQSGTNTYLDAESGVYAPRS